MNRTYALAASAFLLSACASTEPTGSSATATLSPASGSEVHGEVTFFQVGENRVRVRGEFEGGAPGPKGVHIHEKGDCSAPDAMSAGSHFNPLGRKHGGSAMIGHTGDLGNIVFDRSGYAKIDLVLRGFSVSRDAPNGILGRAVVIHMQPDDMSTDPSGNAGGRAACGVIE